MDTLLDEFSRQEIEAFLMSRKMLKRKKIPLTVPAIIKKLEKGEITRKELGKYLNRFDK